MSTFPASATSQPQADGVMPVAALAPARSTSWPQGLRAMGESVTLEGSGTGLDPYLVSTATEWNALAEYMTADSATLEGKYVRLTADLDFSQAGITPMPFFNGDLDGAGKTLKGIADSTSIPISALMITQAGAAANIHDFTVEGELVANHSYTSPVVGRLYGSISSVESRVTITAGECYGVAGVVGVAETGSSVRCCTYSGQCVTSGTYGGGVVGFAQGATIDSCVNAGNITASAPYSGGVVGFATTGSVVSNCVNEGSLTGKYYYYGGVVCWLRESTMTSCSNRGTVTAANIMYGYSGGVVGVVDTLAVVTDCCNTGSATLCGPYSGGVAGFIYYSSVTDCSNSGDVTLLLQASGGVIGYVSAGCEVARCVNKGAVSISTKWSGGVIGYVWQGNVADCVNDSTGTVTTSAMYTGGVIGDASTGSVVTGCINLADFQVSTSYFGGVMGYALGATISQCRNEGSITSSSTFVAGLAPTTGTGCTFKDCSNSGEITCTSSTADCYAAGLVASASGGSYYSCRNTADITAQNASSKYVAGLIAHLSESDTSYDMADCHNSGSVTGGYCVAGIVATSVETTSLAMTDCQNSGLITATGTAAGNYPTAGVIALYPRGSSFTRCTNSGDVTSAGTYWTAGVLGYRTVTPVPSYPIAVTGCSNSGHVTAAAQGTGGVIGYVPAYTTVDSCLNMGRVTSSGCYTGGIAGQLAGSGTTTLTNCGNSATVECDNAYAGGIVGYNASTSTVSGCFNTGNVIATGACVGGIAGLGTATFTNVYNMGHISGQGYVGGLIGLTTEGKTSVEDGYSAGTVSADGTCGNILGISTSDTGVWSSENSLAGTYYLSENAVEYDDNYSTALSRAQLAKLDIGGNWTKGDDYTYPRLTTLADNDYAKVYAAAVVPAEGEGYSSITQGFSVGTPDGVTWTASTNAITFDGNTATFTQTLSGTVTLTATCGEAVAETEITCNVDVESVNKAVADNRTAVGERIFTLDGQPADLGPGTEAKDVYIVVRIYDDGTTQAQKEMR